MIIHIIQVKNRLSTDYEHEQIISIFMYVQSGEALKMRSLRAAAEPNQITLRLKDNERKGNALTHHTLHYNVQRHVHESYRS